MKRYLIAGLLVWVPLGITFLVIRALVGVMDRTLLLLPPDWRPEALLGFPVPGLGIVLSILVVLVTGMVVANLLGRKLVEGWESLLNRIPLVRSIYSAVKQILETIFVAGGKSFRKVLMVEYPRRGLWTLAFQTGSGTEEVHDKAGHRLMTVFVPTTPNPTSGFIILVPEEDIIELDMSVEDGLKLIMSLGVVAPPTRAKVAPERGNS
ncbi:MAG: DUF502 domain-containing protein [Gammaproteobacteria bacterium]|nr:DUF502 domain-containing protein [Gammaproteobacteria bacterium]MDX5374587.1 DUF502 domain-containing protein [Gammaproteobacteria bacterium]